MNQKLKQVGSWALCNGGFAALVVAGGLFGQEWAKNIVAFGAWVLVALAAFVCVLLWVVRACVHIDEEMGDYKFPLDKVQRRHERVVPRWLDRIFDILVTLALAGLGWFGPAVGYLIHVVLIWGALSSEKVLREKHVARIERALKVKL